MTIYVYNLSICAQWFPYGHKWLGHKTCFFYIHVSRNGKKLAYFKRGILKMMDCSLFFLILRKNIKNNIIFSFMSIEFRRDCTISFEEFSNLQLIVMTFFLFSCLQFFFLDIQQKNKTFKILQMIDLFLPICNTQGFRLSPAVKSGN